MDQPVLLLLQSQSLARIIQGSCLQIDQELLLPLPISQQLMALGPGLLQLSGSQPLLAPGGGHWRQERLHGVASKTIQPKPLLSGTGQLLTLALGGEIQQQRPQLLHLIAIDHHAIEAMATHQSPFTQPPFPGE